jgi:hypothetical protein
MALEISVPDACASPAVLDVSGERCNVPHPAS